MKGKKLQLKTTQLVKQIKKNLIRENLWEKGIIEYSRSDSKKSLQLLKQRIEFTLITARDYQDPEYIFPKNPLGRFIKKIILSVLKVFTKYQIVFNKNILTSLENLYKYLDILEKAKKK